MQSGRFWLRGVLYDAFKAFKGSGANSGLRLIYVYFESVPKIVFFGTVP